VISTSITQRAMKHKTFQMTRKTGKTVPLRVVTKPCIHVQTPRILVHTLSTSALTVVMVHTQTAVADATNCWEKLCSLRAAVANGISSQASR
jgi:hypothetical protein